MADSRHHSLTMTPDVIVQHRRLDPMLADRRVATMHTARGPWPEADLH